MTGMGTLYFFCAKMGAGKSTMAVELATEKRAVLISEDEWLSSLYPGQITTFDDYRTYASRLKPLIRKHVLQILGTGTDVVMDFPANTQQQRRWFKQLIDEVSAPHELIVLQVSDERCLRQIAKRREQQPERHAFDNPQTFYLVSEFFEPPHGSEGLNMRLVSPAE